MDITLDDLLVLEPRLVWGQGRRDRPGPLRRTEAVEVSWAVTARATPPHLPHLRGGEVVLVPAGVKKVVGAELPALLREAGLRRVSAVVFDRGGPRADRTYPNTDNESILLWSGELATDTEAGINRLLTECRGNLYRVGSAVERQLSDLTVNRSGIETLVHIASDSSGLPMVVLDARGRRLAASGEENLEVSEAELRSDEYHVRTELPQGLRLVLGPLRPDQRVVARFLVDRIGAAASAAAQRDDAARPRGPRRAEATEALLTSRHGNASDQRAAALALGLDPDAMYFVAVSSGAFDSILAKALAPLGTTHPAGAAHGRRVTLVMANGQVGSDNLASRVSEVKRRWTAEIGQDTSTIALSAPALGVASLAGAAREATFVAALQAQPHFPLRAASFESVEDVGAFRLLYQLRESDELRQFVSQALGTLPDRDRQGTLRATLRAFLESGGSQVVASSRLGIHRNTLAYRLRRIGELVGRDVADPGSWLTLHLALRASEMLAVCADER